MDWNNYLAQVQPNRIAGTMLRLVESQEQVATNQLVSTLERQAILEELLEGTKPKLRADTAGLHYLLATPFRYPPLKWGSRFGSRSEPSLFYGSLSTQTVLIEAAYYRFVFWQGMSTPPPHKLDTQHTLFGAEYATDLGLQLQAAPFDAHMDVLTSPEEYSQTQALGSLMRTLGIQAFEYASARDREHGINVALFSPQAFVQPKPVFEEAWLGEVDGTLVRFRAAHGRSVHSFPIESFLIDGSLPQAA